MVSGQICVSKRCKMHVGKRRVKAVYKTERLTQSFWTAPLNVNELHKPLLSSLVAKS